MAIVGHTTWHLAEVPLWRKANTAVPVSDDLIAVAEATAKINHDLEADRLGRLGALA